MTKPEEIIKDQKRWTFNGKNWTYLSNSEEQAKFIGDAMREKVTTLEFQILGSVIILADSLQMEKLEGVFGFTLPRVTITLAPDHAAYRPASIMIPGDNAVSFDDSLDSYISSYTSSNHSTPWVEKARKFEGHKLRVVPEDVVRAGEKRGRSQ